MCCLACDFIREIRAIRGQKHNRILTTDNADGSQCLQESCSGPEKQSFRGFGSMSDGEMNLEYGAVQSGVLKKERPGYPGRS